MQNIFFLSFLDIHMDLQLVSRDKKDKKKYSLMIICFLDWPGLKQAI